VSNQALRAVKVGVLLCAWLAGASLDAASQITNKPVRIGYIHGEHSARMPDPPRDAFRARMKELGYAEGRDYVLEIRAIEAGRMDQAARLADEIAASQPDIFVAVGAFFARQAKRAVRCEGCAKPVPLVFGVVVDPLVPGLELVPDLKRPGGHITGVTSFFPEQQRERVRILKQAIPTLKRVAILAEQPIGERLSKAQAAAALAQGVESRTYLIEHLNPDLEGIFRGAAAEGVDAVIVIEQPATNRNAPRIAETAANHKLPTLFAGDYAGAGGTLTFGATLGDAGVQIANHVDRIIKGAKPGELPVVSLERRPLTINLKKSREIGMTIPPEMLRKADRIIE
jgi:putative tryptophan/tyrosine transport system substrate-binding protein